MLIVGLLLTTTTTTTGTGTSSNRHLNKTRFHILMVWCCRPIDSAYKSY